MNFFLLAPKDLLSFTFLMNYEVKVEVWKAALDMSSDNITNVFCRLIIYGHKSFFGLCLRIRRHDMAVIIAEFSFRNKTQA